jgi:hypothetical protein
VGFRLWVHWDEYMTCQTNQQLAYGALNPCSHSYSTACYSFILIRKYTGMLNVGTQINVLFALRATYMTCEHYESVLYSDLKASSRMNSMTNIHI